MTPLAPSQIPPNCDTLEKLAVWAGLALQAINPSMVAIEGVGYSERVAQGNPFFVAADNRHRMVIRLSIPLDSNYLAGGLKTWTYAQILASTAIPTQYGP